MRRLIIPVLVFLFSGAVLAQDRSSMATTKLPEDARFEIIQSPWDSNTTFRLDRFRGQIDRLGTCAKDDSVGSNKCWKEMIVLEIARAGVQNRPRFQIIFHPQTKTIFLLQNESGLTWQYALDATEKWHPFVDCQDKTNSQCLWRPLP